VWFISLTALPLADTDDFGKFGGAHVNCWVLLPERDALARATRLVEGYGWRVERIDESREVARSDYAEDASELAYFEQALSDQEVMVFHTWPNEAEDRGVTQ
jgi:hypothetical protein